MKQRNDKQPLLYIITDLIPIPIKLHKYIPNGYWVMGCTRIFEKKKNQRGITLHLRKGGQPLLHATHRLYLIYIPIKLHVSNETKKRKTTIIVYRNRPNIHSYKVA